jgi:hypothetical protein
MDYNWAKARAAAAKILLPNHVVLPRRHQARDVVALHNLAADYQTALDSQIP